jgi:hypothetical protein
VCAAQYWNCASWYSATSCATASYLNATEYSSGPSAGLPLRSKRRQLRGCGTRRGKYGMLLLTGLPLRSKRRQLRGCGTRRGKYGNDAPQLRVQGRHGGVCAV